MTQNRSNPSCPECGHVIPQGALPRSAGRRWTSYAKLAGLFVGASALGTAVVAIWLIAIEPRDDWHTARDREWMAKYKDTVK